MPTLVEVENMNRERQGRLLPIESVRQGAALGVRQAQSGNATSDESGYYDDAAGAYKLFFQFGVSKFGDGSVFK